MRLRIAYENDMVKDYVDQKIKGSPQRRTVSVPSESEKKDSGTFEKTTEGKLDKLRIAVLPFANISPDPKDEYFADEMTEELISTLSKISHLKVIARTSVMGYKSGQKKIREIAKELEVGTVLEGSVR
jgi:TolB-like protein